MNCDPSVRLSVFPIRIAAQSAVHVSTGVARWGSFCPICSNCAMLIEWGGGVDATFTCSVLLGNVCFVFGLVSVPLNLFIVLA